MGKKTVDSSKPGEPEQTRGKLVNRIIQNIDIDNLVDSVADQLSEKIFAKFPLSDVEDKLFDKYQEELQASIMEAIIQQLQANRNGFAISPDSSFGYFVRLKWHYGP